MGIRWDPVSTWYLLVVTAGLLRSQTHDWVLWWGITEADTVLTSPAVSRAGIKIWHPQWSSVDTNWAWSQRKCLSPPLSTQPFCPHHKKTSSNVFYISLFYFNSCTSLSFIFPKASLSCCSPSSLNPSLPTSPCPSSSHLQILSSAQHWFSANFSSLLEHQSLWHSSSWLLWWLHTASLGLGGGQLKRRMRTLESRKCCLLQVA